MKSALMAVPMGILMVSAAMAAPSSAETGAVLQTRVIVSDDFESGIVASGTTDAYGKKTGMRLHAEYPRLRAFLGGHDPSGVTGVYLHTNSAASGSNAIQIVRSKDISDGYPILSWWLFNDEVVRSGNLIISFDHKYPKEEGNSLSIQTRAYQGIWSFRNHRQDAFSLIITEGWAQLSGKRMPAVADVWTRYELSFPLGRDPGTVRLRAFNDVLGEQVIEAPMSRPHLTIDWIGFMVQGQEERRVLLDNIDIYVENEQAPVTEDQETAPPDHGEDGWGLAPAALLDVFPDSSYEGGAQGKTEISSTYYPSGSTWLRELDERVVFHRELKSDRGQADSFSLRIGKGGQVYSLRGAFGESVPPSFREDGASSPWNDEVWQFVAICGKYNDTLHARGELSDEVKQRIDKTGFPRLHYFIHNSGAYMEGDLHGLDNLYCPMLAADAPGDGRTYRTINWGLIPWNTPHRSPLLYYVQTRDLGDGVIELTYVVHNFSVRDDIVFDWLNAPWGGTRYTSLPFHYMSRPDGELWDAKTFFVDMDSWESPISVRETGGWNLSAAGEDPDSPSLALVFGRDKRLEEEQEKRRRGEPWCQVDGSIYRGARAFVADEFLGQSIPYRPDNAFRNYDVAVVIPKFLIRPGESVWYRSYLVVNSRDKAVAKAKELVDHVDYGLVHVDPETTSMVTVKVDGAPGFNLYSKPVPGSQPLFLLENETTGQEIITTDLYRFFDKEKLNWELPDTHPDADYYNSAYAYRLEQHNTKWKRLLGYGLKNKPGDTSFVQLSGMLDPLLFPEADPYHLDLWVRK